MTEQKEALESAMERAWEQFVIDIQPLTIPFTKRDMWEYGYKAGLESRDSQVIAEFIEKAWASWRSRTEDVGFVETLQSVAGEMVGGKMVCECGLAKSYHEGLRQPPLAFREPNPCTGYKEMSPPSGEVCE